MNTVAVLNKSDVNLIKSNINADTKINVKKLTERLIEFSQKIEQWKDGDEINITEQEHYKNDMEVLEHIISDYKFLLSITVFDKKLTHDEKLAWIKALKTKVDESKFNLAED